MNTHIQTTKKLLDRHFHRSKHSRLALGVIAKGESFNISFSEQQEDLYQIPFGLGSISKTFIGAYIAKLIQENKLSLVDTIDVYLPLDNKAYAYPTIEQLTTHTSGYSFFIPRFKTLSSMMFYGFNKRNVYTNIDSDWVTTYLNKHKPSKIKKYRYSDFNYAILSKIIEHITESNIRDVMHVFLREELKLSQTYLADYKKTVEDPYSWNFEDDNPFVPAGCMFSTVHDMLKFMNYHIQNPNYIKHVFAKYHQTAHKDIYSGFSWNSFKNGHYYWHIGGQGYYRSYALFDTKRHIAVVILATVDIDFIHIGRLGSSIYRNVKRNYVGLNDFMKTYTRHHLRR